MTNKIPKLSFGKIIILQAFKESLKNINREEFLKLIAEIEAEPQNENELTVGEFLDLMKNLKPLHKQHLVVID